MSVRSDTSSLGESGGLAVWGRIGMTPTRYALVIYALLLPYASVFFHLLQPLIATWLFRIGLLLFIPFVILSVVILFRGTKKSFLIFLGTWVWLVLSYSPSTEAVRTRLLALGFRIYVWNVDDFLTSSCRLTEFAESGVKYKAGQCDGFSYDPIFERIVYDSSGEIALPLSRRSSEWNDVMRDSSPRGAIRDSEGRAQHLFGNFYLISVYLTELEG